MVIIRGRLTPEAGALLIKALDAGGKALYQDLQRTDVTTAVVDRPDVAQQQADALALVAETALHHGLDPGTPGERYQVVVHVDAAVLADADAPGQSVLEEGANVPAESSQRLACDASRVVMREAANGDIVAMSARTRTIPPALRRALPRRDRGCRFPGCLTGFGEGHHIKHRASGGPTTLSNLATLCRRHHRAVHEEGYGLHRVRMGSWNSARRMAG
jgi:5-methylcytosine-specific restriction endonuclease McrA